MQVFTLAIGPKQIIHNFQYINAKKLFLSLTTFENEIPLHNYASA